jgi:hypothetical protein
MGRAVVEEVATLASLALFLGMVAIWAQVIALSHRGTIRVKKIARRLGCRRAIHKGSCLELRRQVTVDFQSNADFHECGS